MTKSIAAMQPGFLDQQLRTNMNVESKKPERCLVECGRKFSKVWNSIEQVRARRGISLPMWPDWCFFPMSGWATLTHELLSSEAGGKLTFSDAKVLAVQGGAMGTWRYSQGIYRFDESVYSSLVSSALQGDIPSEVLTRLPEWAVYIETPNLLQGRCDGFWALLDWGTDGISDKLIIVLNLRGNLVSMLLSLGGGSIQESLERTFKECGHVDSEEAVVQAKFGALIAAPCISLLLYLCQSEPEIEDERVPGSFPSRAAPRKVKGGMRLFPADRVRTWVVGKETGEKIRQAWQGGEGGKVTPHLRRAHWHGFWKGPLNGERTFSYKWLPPIPVGG